MGAITLHQRLTAQLTPISGLMDEIIDTAHDQCSIKSIGKTWSGLRRDAHRARICGIVVWAHVADGLVEAAAEDRFPDGFAVLTTDKQHNSGRYLFRFPGGVLTIRRTPHDDEKSEGQFMQETFREMIEELDKAALPDETDAARVWIRIAPKGATTFVAQDRHGHQVKVPLADLLQNAAASVQPVSTSPPATTQVRGVTCALWTSSMLDQTIHDTPPEHRMTGRPPGRYPESLYLSSCSRWTRNRAVERPPSARGGATAGFALVAGPPG